MIMTKRLSNRDQKYLDELYKARLAIVTGAQSYSIMGRSVTRASLDLINQEIARLEGTTRPKIRKIIACDR